MNKPIASTRRGFTIIELLVVVTVIAILASFLLPSVLAVKRQSDSFVCVSNEHVLVNGMLAYATDNSGFLPSPSWGWDNPGGTGPNVCWAMDSWGIADFNVGQLWKYVGRSAQDRAKILWCPSDNQECVPTVGGPVPCDRNFTYSFNCNIRYGAGGPGPTMKLVQIKHPDLHVMLYEEFGPNDGSCCGPGDGDDWLTGRHGPLGSTQYRSSYGNIAWRNDGKGNVGYFDGHVSLMSVTEYFAPTPPNRPNHFYPLTN